MMLDVPWFMLSPGIGSLSQYAVLTWILSRHLLKTVNYKRAPQLLSLVEGFMIVAFFVVVTDAFWCFFCALRWLPTFPQNLLQIVSSFFRDVAAAALFFFMIGGYFRNGVLNFKKIMPWLLLCFVSQGIWFLLAPSMPYTNYIYAYRIGFPSDFVFGSFILSHFVMRVPLWISIFKSRRLDVS